MVALTLVGLCATVAGCVSDMGAPAADGSGVSQLRYYGGPKYPMWLSQSGRDGFFAAPSGKARPGEIRNAGGRAFDGRHEPECGRKIIQAVSARAELCVS